jgi:hypothetical protein
MTKYINFWAGPGTGKSSCAADLFAEMKWGGHNVELIDEYAKIKTWEKHLNILEDQMYVSAKQNRKLERLQGQVDWVITDSPLLMCVPYVPMDYCSYFKPLIRQMFDRYDNINYFLIREKAYNPVGRNQTEEEAKALDSQIKDLLISESLEFKELPANRSTKFEVMKDLGLL